ncbi:ComEC/Rec2 family competence protein [Gemmiger formicilis]|uniref:ComEC/Rec2 family competence protein n=1 Tax=Gemmiger formicilis TaxID=745368 RepID=UPI001957F988|nr:ComEC/Rec2 family competence protein [Gemmiger formicilis]
MTRKLAGFGFAFAMAELAAVCLPPLAVLPTAAFVVLILLFCALRKHSFRPAAAPVLAGVMSGLLWAFGFGMLVVEPQLRLAGQTVTARAVVMTDAEASYQDGSLRGTLHLVQMNGRDCNIKVNCSAFPAAEPGDRFEATFTLQAISSDRYRQSHYADGVYLEAEYTGGYAPLEPSGSWIFGLYRLRQRLSRALCVWMPAELGGIEAAMLLGDKSRLTQTVEDAFRAAGVSHLLAISGLHLSLLCGILAAGGRKWRFFRPYLAVQALMTVFYMALTGFPVSVLRAGIIYLIALLGYALLQPPDLLNSLGLAAVLISLPNAWAPCDIGFQLSFCGVLGVQLSGRLGEWQRQRLLPEGEDDARTWRYRVMERALRILEAVETAAVASLATLPVLMVHGLSASGAAIPANLLTVWMLRPALILGLLVLVAAALPWLGPLHHLLSLALSVWLSWQYALVRWCTDLPGARLYLPRRYALLIWCVLAGLGLVFWAKRRMLWYIPAAVTCLGLAIVLGVTMQAGVLRVLMVGTAGNACTVLIRDGQAVVLFRGGAANLNAVWECLAENGAPAWTAVIDLRQEKQTLDFSEASMVVELSRLQGQSCTVCLADGITADCYGSSDGTLCVVQVDAFRLAAAAGQPDLPAPVYVDLLCAAGSLPDCVSADIIMVNTVSPRWLEKAETVVFGGEEPAAAIRPGKSIVLEEGKAVAVQ